MVKPVQERYVAGSLPDSPQGLIQFFYDELPRISRGMDQLVAGFSVEQQAASVIVDPLPNEFRLFEGETPIYDLPGGSWNSTLGEWEVPASGIYQLNVNSIIDPFGTGNKNYAATLRLYIDNVEYFRNSAVGQDDFPLSCSMALSGLLVREQILRTTITLVHEQFTGLSDVQSAWSITSTALQP